MQRVIVTAAGSLSVFFLASAFTYAATFSYGSDPAQQLDTCAPHSAGTHAGVLMIHGGGWIAGDKSGYAWLCQKAADHDIVGVPVNYRLADGSAEHLWPAQLDDVRAAAKWVVKHAKELDIEGRRLCVLGDSAGAQLAVSLALSFDITHFACAVDQYGPVDLTDWPGTLTGLFGVQAPEVVRALKREMSPLFLVTRLAPPMLIVQGTLDKAVPFSQSQSLYNAMRKAGASVQMITFEGDHAFVGISDSQRESIFQAELDFIASSTASRRR